MTPHVHLVVANSLLLHDGFDIIHIFLRATERRNAGTRIADFRSGHKDKRQIAVAVFFAFRKNINKRIALVVKVMYRIGIIPEQTKILGCRLHGGNTAHNACRIGNAGRIGILRYAPHTLDSRILNKLFY